MGRLAVVLGSSATGPGAERLLASLEGHGAELLQRHRGDPDPGSYVLPHRIDHEANLRDLLEAGCDRVLAVCSVGSLKEEIGVGSLVCPDDFIALQLGVTTFDDARGHMPPGFDPGWRERVLAASRAAGADFEDGGVYWQTVGPRFETPAEIRLLAGHADLVGMTMASECVVAGELGLAYAAVCSVDNMANGVAAAPLEVEELEAARARNAARLGEALEAILPRLGTEGG
jgi:5'-methylthioadenosine phosphorylase